MAVLGRLVMLIAALAIGGKAMAAISKTRSTSTCRPGASSSSCAPISRPAHLRPDQGAGARGFYDGIVFHRVIDGFMAQTGDPTGTGTGGSGHPLKAEFSNEPFVRGTVSMARTSDPNSADSQFFIMFAPAPSLDGKYTIWGKVTSGMEYIDEIKKGDPTNNGTVTNPDKIIKMQVAADAEKAAPKPGPEVPSSTQRGESGGGPIASPHGEGEVGGIAIRGRISPHLTPALCAPRGGEGAIGGAARHF